MNRTYYLSGPTYWSTFDLNGTIYHFIGENHREKEKCAGVTDIERTDLTKGDDLLTFGDFIAQVCEEAIRDEEYVDIYLEKGMYNDRDPILSFTPIRYTKNFLHACLYQDRCDFSPYIRPEWVEVRFDPKTKNPIRNYKTSSSLISFIYFGIYQLKDDVQTYLFQQKDWQMQPKRLSQELEAQIEQLADLFEKYFVETDIYEKELIALFSNRYDPKMYDPILPNFSTMTSFLGGFKENKISRAVQQMPKNLQKSLKTFTFAWYEKLKQDNQAKIDQFSLLYRKHQVTPDYSALFEALKDVFNYLSNSDMIRFDTYLLARLLRKDNDQSVTRIVITGASHSRVYHAFFEYLGYKSKGYHDAEESNVYYEGGNKTYTVCIPVTFR